ncbi:hypothetical protein [Phocaeicola barnesiae]|nr:hypothetical protein [Phocaeicola barnesiae]
MLKMTKVPDPRIPECGIKKGNMGCNIHFAHGIEDWQAWVHF